MLVTDALQELTTQLDVLCVATQSWLFTRLARQFARLTQCEDRVHAAALSIRERETDDRRAIERRERELEKLHAKHKALVTRSQRERQDRSEEKEWLAELWPDGVVLPTILKPYAPDEMRSLSHVEAQDERRRLQALVQRRVARERVLQQLEIASQWKTVVVPPTTSPDGDYVASQVYYENKTTGESTWDAPVAMFYEPPAHWDSRKMDWKDSYGLEHFYPKEDDDVKEVVKETGTPTTPNRPPSSRPASGRVALMAPIASVEKEASDSDDDDDGDDEDEEEKGEEPLEQVASTSRTRPTARTGRSDDDDDVPLDPVTLRHDLEAAMARTKELQDQLTKTTAERRSLSLQLLNATRESFEREKETLAAEDETVKSAERARRKAEKDQEIAAKAAQDAKERKALDKNVQTKFARDSVAKKDMTLAKDDEALEQELAAFAVEQRVNRLYLAAPIAMDERVKFRHQYDDEFVHMKHMEAQQLAVEQTEFDLLEKTALRLEEATKRCGDLREQLETAKRTQLETDAELAELPSRIAALEAPFATPREPRPSDETLTRARERFVTSGTAETKEEDDGDAEEATPKAQDEDHEEKEEEEEEEEEEEPRVVGTPMDPAAAARDEVELLTLKHAVDLDATWRDWEAREVERLEALATAYDRFQALERLQRRLVVEIALLQGDLAFFEQLADREKQLNDMLWTLQACGHVERARFLIERAAREESIFQVTDAYDAVVKQLEDARRLPRRARNPLEKLELIETSKRQAEELQQQLKELQTRCDKEHEAKRLLVTLETRFSDYTTAKLDEEAALFAEKQALWDLNTSLHDELTATRATIDELYAVLDGATPENEPEAESAARARYDDVSTMFHEKLARLEGVRQFLLLCYTRESRWRELAAVALVKDTTSDAWMTSMQRERQEQTLVTLAQQHDLELRALRREIKLLTKVKAQLLDDIRDRDVKLEAVRLEYQESSEAVRLETEQIVLGLKQHLADEQAARTADQRKSQQERSRLLADQAARTKDLQQRIADLEAENEQQRHWLTAARRELHAQRVANDALLIGYQSLEKRRATETNDMRFRIGAQITKINSIEMWNQSLKLQAREAHAARVATQRETEKLIHHHKQQQRVLRLEHWKHCVTAQAILTNVSTLFSFFADGLAILAGATPEANDALRRNGGIDVLAVLAKRCEQPHVRAIAAAALGQIAWNANVTPRALGWRAKKCWFNYQQRLSRRVLEELEARNLAFDSVADEKMPEMNWLADPNEIETKKLRFLETWNARDAIARPNVNCANQAYVALAPTVLKTLIDLCQHATDVVIQRHALRSLALVAMDARNTAIVGRIDGCIPLLVTLVMSEDDVAIQRHAIYALANLAFENRENQTRIGSAGAIPMLLQHCHSHDNVDVLVASVEALAHVSYQHAENGAAIVAADGLAILSRVCDSPRIHDVVELDVFETIQARAAETIANVLSDVENPASVIAGVGIATFVRLCASCTRDVAFHGVRVLASLAQCDSVRAAIGAHGGIDALFVLARQHDDRVLVTHATWALANATWNRENQYRVARYLEPLYALATFSITATTHDNNNDEEDEEETVASPGPIREHALCIVANALFYNDANRLLVGAHSEWMALLVHLCRTASGLILEHAARALCALSYSDAVALAFGGATAPSDPDALAPARAVNGLEIFIKLCGQATQPLVQQHGLYGVINMCLHDANKAKLLEIPHAIETLVNLSGATDRALCDPAIEALDLLADVRQSHVTLVGSHTAAVLAPSTMSSLAANDLKKLLTMLQDATANPALVAMACDAIADEVWKKPSAKVRLRNEHGLETLLDLCVGPTVAAHERVLLSCLWALRHSVSDNARNQDVVGALGGVPRLVDLLTRQRHRDDVVEAVLAVLIALVLTHARNSTDLIQHGVDVLVPLADAPDTDEDEARREVSTTKSSPASPANRALAKELLQLLAPYTNSSSTSNSLPPVGGTKGPSSPEKHRVSTKKPTHLPLLGTASPLAASVSPTKRTSNN